MTTATTGTVGFTNVLVQGGTPEEGGYAADRITKALTHTDRAVLHTRVRLTHLEDPALTRPCLAQANIDLSGRLVRAQASAATMHAAIDEVHDRLRDRLARAEHHEMVPPPEIMTPKQRAERPTPRAWPEEHTLVRHKSLASGRMSVDEAAYEMELLDYAFYLFVERETGADSFLYRSDGDGKYHLQQAARHPTPPPLGEIDTVLDHRHPPRLSTPEAIGHLELAGEPFVFFIDAITWRGCVLYRRYDGDFGLITPSDLTSKGE